MVCMCHLKTCFPTYNQIRKQGINFNRFYILKNSLKKGQQRNGDKKISLLKLSSISHSELLSVDRNLLKSLRKFSPKVFLNEDQLKFLYKLTMRKENYDGEPTSSKNSIAIQTDPIEENSEDSEDFTMMEIKVEPQSPEPDKTEQEQLENEEDGENQELENEKNREIQMQQENEEIQLNLASIKTEEEEETHHPSIYTLNEDRIDEEDVNIQILSQAESELIMSNIRDTIAKTVRHNPLYPEVILGQGNSNRKSTLSKGICLNHNCSGPRSSQDSGEFCEDCFCTSRSSFDSSGDLSEYVRSKRGRPPAEISDYPPDYGANNPREKNNLASMMSRRKRRIADLQLDVECQNLLTRNLILQETLERKRIKLEKYKSVCCNMIKRWKKEDLIREDR